jgi:hypothetical protein
MSQGRIFFSDFVDYVMFKDIKVTIINEAWFVEIYGKYYTKSEKI